MEPGMTAVDVLYDCQAIAEAGKRFGAAATTHIVLPEGMDGIVAEVARLAGAKTSQQPYTLSGVRLELVSVELFDSAISLQSSYRAAEPQRVSP